MNWIDQISVDNFHQSFDISNILVNSVYYPLSGIDATDIVCLSGITNSFVHVDSTSEEVVKRAMLQYGAGYKLIGLKYLSENELTPYESNPNYFSSKDSEIERIAIMPKGSNSQSFFCFWAVYELDEFRKGSGKKIKKFSLLHIGGMPDEIFYKLYVHNRVNPKGVSILKHGNGCDNDTKFPYPEYRLLQLMKLNSHENNVELPQYVFTNIATENNCFWPGYEFNKVEHYSNPNGNWDHCTTFKKIHRI